MIRTYFYLKTDKQNNNGESAIYAKIKLHGKTSTLSTGKYIEKDRWESTNKLKNTLRITSEKNCLTTLKLIESKVESIYLKLVKANENVTLNDIKNQLKGKPDKSNHRDILKLFQEHNDYFKRKYEAGERTKASLQKYNRAKDLISNFLHEKYRKKDLDITEIDNAFIYELEHFLKYESRFKGKVGINHNSVVKYFQCYKTMCRYGIKRNLIEKNPFLVYDEKLVIKDAVFLTQDELQRIENKVFSSERLNRVKDIFLFSCYTSYAPVDVKNLTRKNLIKDNEGTLWIKTNRAKTSIKSNVPVLPPVQRIIEKYQNLEDDKLLPAISNQKINEYLKEIAVLCSIEKKLTHYVARHTFATTVTLGNGISIENVSSMMGHSKITMTQHYAKVLDSSVKKDMNKLRLKLA
ncbi:site-specific integrase [Leeuwenhoekiella marinoflava]|uniref:Site-specific recombinase XerD n=2 Tax=Leeuwenhoekiella marinoflava TaxID=988 RepID=A0A4Q0PLT3_9FLAO|nr:site-specific integrase [Leeuwenhoekiella marinoflava]RXG30660.1 site-specific recombinase XerD [Leeuwenhoekiella marinoflava]SHF20459.1 Site-specific recombinase XerD [Leeuwenhoekiella marinoflava DSM 3653]